MANKTTTDHEEIRRWVEERGGWPAEVRGTERGTDDTGIIRIDFPGWSGEGKLARIGWDEWFRKFDASGLAFIYQDTIRGQRSNFNKLIARETAEARSRGDNDASRRSLRGARGRTGARAARGGAARTRKASGGGTRKAAGGRTRKAGATRSARGGAKRTAARGTRRAPARAVARSAGRRGGTRRGGTSRRTPSSRGGSRRGGRGRSR